MRRLFYLSIACTIAAPQLAQCADARDWTAIKPGMPRKLVEPIVEKHQEKPPESDDSDDSEVALPSSAMALYETPKHEIEGYRLNDREVLVVPYVREKKRADEESPGGKLQHEEQKVAARPWVIQDSVTAFSQTPPDSFVRIEWPRNAARTPIDWEKLRVHVLEGNLFGNGDVALAAFFGTEDNSLTAFASYRLKNNRWELRSFFDADPGFPAASKSGRFIEFMELNGDSIPEIALHLESGRRGNAYAIYRYDPHDDLLHLAIADIVDPGWDGSRVGSFVHYGGGHSAESVYAWKGFALVLRSVADQGGPSANKVGLPKEESFPEGSIPIAVRYAERDPKSLSVVRQFTSIGNIPWIEGAMDAASGRLWTVTDIGQMRRHIAVQPDPDKMQHLAPAFSAYDLGNAIFPYPEKFAKTAKAKLASSGKAVRIADFATVEIQDEWPLVLSEEAIVLADDDRIVIPPNRAEAAKKPDPFDEQSESSIWRSAFVVGPKATHFRAGDPVVLYISGPDLLADSASLSLKEARLDGSTLNIVCALKSMTGAQSKKLVRPALALNLGVLKPDWHTVHIAIVTEQSANDDEASPRSPIECGFRVE